MTQNEDNSTHGPFGQGELNTYWISCYKIFESNLELHIQSKMILQQYLTYKMQCKSDLRRGVASLEVDNIVVQRNLPKPDPE